MVDIITARQEIGKFFYENGFGELLSSVPQNGPAEIIFSLAMKGNQSKTTDFAGLKQGYRTTYGHFLSKGKWEYRQLSLCYCLRRCCPENGSKIDMAVELLDTLPEADARVMSKWIAGTPKRCGTKRLKKALP